MRIACPKCEWEPPPSARWSCTCGHAWNTFETGGQCPECKAVWRDTQCLACRRWSKHHDWYHDLPPVDVESIVTQQDVPMTVRSMETIAALARRRHSPQSTGIR